MLFVLLCQQVEEIKGIMLNNIDQVLKRGVDLDGLMHRTDDLLDEVRTSRVLQYEQALKTVFSILVASNARNKWGQVSECTSSFWDVCSVESVGFKSDLVHAPEYHHASSRSSRDQGTTLVAGHFL
jgi:hypothetical protein